ncbi:amidase domain-containing protein [Streptomyces sp. 5.8]|uniref:amidase domain-containing protein n=1 Tax=Streptomyces sp. 5.8 TaxID=3406571 RepID=UPI003BB64F46
MSRTRVPVRAASAVTLALASLSLGIAAPASQAAETALPTADKSQLAQIADTYLQRRADAVTLSRTQTLRAPAPLALTAQAADVLGGEITALQANATTLEKRWSGFSRAEVTVIPGKGTVSGDTATLAIEEETRLYLADVKEGATITYTTYVLPHTLTFKRAADGAWKLADDQTPANGSGPAVPTQLEGPATLSEPVPDDEILPAPVDEGPKPPPSSDVPGGDAPLRDKTMDGPLAGYNYTSMVNYARKYSLRGNGNFRTYGQDCTNFISQAVAAGGWAQTSGGIFDRANTRKWWYGSLSSTTSYTWAGAENWYWFARNSGRAKNISNVWNMFPSDVLQADWGPNPNSNLNHTMMVTGREGGMLYLSYHTPNSVDMPLSYIKARNPGTWFYAHRT